MQIFLDKKLLHKNMTSTSTYPTLKGKGQLKACHEIHIFLADLFAPKDGKGTEEEQKKFLIVRERYEKAVAAWNSLPSFNGDFLTQEPMKKPILTLIFRNGTGEQPITVCQSARHIFCDDQKVIIQAAKDDAAHFEACGFQVARVKIEAMAYGIDGIPQTIDEAKVFPSCYFEFHILVQHVGTDDDAAPQLITEKEETLLRQISNKVSKNLQVPVPLSFNTTKNENNTKNGGCQRFLNARFRGLGIVDIEPKLATIRGEIASCGQFKVIKIISEYVWYDTYNEMDHGWIDYSEQELAALQKRLNEEN